jgi:predicted Ser/Thr protein kinase
MTPLSMVQCPKCSAQNLPESRFCSSCAQPLSSISQMPTAEGPVPESPHAARIISSDSVPAGGFTPGTILADRYRIIGLLGRGGMGEVYRADDLKLGQPVALKFLPPKLAQDPVRRERFFAEVRITRQLSHPNICRVYDIQEIDGRHFLSMEYIDGEDLASLIKRIGHLTNEKALDIARQLAAGLAAAHERGVLHRDLKPANIMLDGHGRVRITDFGLAIAAEDEVQTIEIAGTPAYMAPEQLAGKGSTVRSDIYSLGLVLYEIYTGNKAFAATTIAELREQKETHTPRAPSEIREGIDPMVERLIRRCMERDPNARPASVAQLALALPGGDPLAAAIAAGETPSPEMVAASGAKEGLRPAVAWSLLAFIIAGTLAIVAMHDRFWLYRRIPFKNPPATLIERSHEILKRIGYTEKPAESAYGFARNEDLLRYMLRKDKTANRWKNLDAKAILFWYRQSPGSLGIFRSTVGSVAPDNPPLRREGEVQIILDSEGYLVSFLAVPPQAQSSKAISSEPDWTILFAEAGLDRSQWTPTESEWNPSFYADAKATWQGFLPNRPGTPIRIKAAALQGKPISFEIMDPWSQPAQVALYRQTVSERMSGIGAAVIFVPALLGGLFFARRNLRLGRGDRRNAKRLALFFMSLSFLAWILRAPQDPALVLLFLPYMAGLIWLLYMAIEPFVRRRWPHILISWTRLLSGEWRDPLVARDLLIACAFGVLLHGLHTFTRGFVRVWAGYAEGIGVFNGSSVMSPRFFVSLLLDRIQTGILLYLLLACLLVLLVVLLRNQKIAVAVGILALTLILGPENPVDFSMDLVLGALLIFLLLRFGLLAEVFGFFVGAALLNAFPITLDASAWYSRSGFAALAIFAAIVLYAFRFSLGGRPLLAPSRLDD